MHTESPFVHLHLHSEYSLLDGAIKIPELIQHCVDQKIPAVALTDSGVMFGCIDFYLAAKEAGIKPIIGCEVYLTDDIQQKKRGSNRLILLCKTQKGYQNLSQLVSLSHIEGFYYTPRVDMKLLSQFSQDLIAISPGMNGPVAYEIRSNRFATAEQNAEALKEIYGKDFYLGVQSLGEAFEDRIIEESTAISKSLSIPTVATNDVYYLKEEDAFVRDILNCIQRGELLEEFSGRIQRSNQHCFRSKDEISGLFPDHAEALASTWQIAEQCDISFNTDKIQLPRFDCPDNKTKEGYLEDLVWTGIRAKYTEITDDIRKRVAFELEIITRMDYPIYFLIIHDFLQYCRDQDIPVGPGRGSAAGSIVAYALDITRVDPLKYNLLFERFLNPDRISMPDIDLDFCIKRREDVIAYLVQKYGTEHVAQIITFGTMQARAVIRDVGRVLGVPLNEVDRIAKLIPATPGHYTSIPDALETIPELRQLAEKNDQYRQLLNFGARLEGHSRHSSTHAAGLVISREPLAKVVPLLKNEGQIVTQYTMNTLETIGLLKMDILGLRNLTVLNDTKKAIEAETGRVLDLDTLTVDDPKTYALLQSGQSAGVFQLESRGMRQLNQDLKPNCFEDLIAVLALYRPGPLGSGMVSEFISNKSGKTKVKYEVPELEPILKDTYGMIVYQEQVMQIASTIGGFSLGEADMLRRAMGKKKKKEMDKMKSSFLDGAKAKKIPEKKAVRIFDLCYKFAEYGFNKSHSAAYAMISYQTAYLKANYPKTYMTSLLTSVADNTDKTAIYIADCRRMKIPVLPPDINHSGIKYLESNEGIRFALCAVKNVGEGAIESIVRNRSVSPYTSLLDFCSRVDLRQVNKRVIESLIKAGAFDTIEKDRNLLLAIYEKILSQAQASAKERESGQTNLFGNMAEEAAAEVTKKADYIPLSDWDKLKLEKESTGLYLSGHPLDHFKKILESAPYHSQSFGPEDTNKNVMLIGTLSDCNRRITKSNREMITATLEDLHGTISILLFENENFIENAKSFQDDHVVRIRGKLRPSQDNLSLVCNSIELLTDDLRPKPLHIEISDSSDKELINTIYKACLKHRGSLPLYFHVEEGVILANQKYWVSDSGKASLEALVGDTRIWSG